MTKYIMEVEAFRFDTPKELAQYPDWFQKAVADGRVQRCGEDYHVIGGDHICPGDFVIKDDFEGDLFGVVPPDDFEKAFKQVQ